MVPHPKMSSKGRTELQRSYLEQKWQAHRFAHTRPDEGAQQCFLQRSQTDRIMPSQKNIDRICDGLTLILQHVVSRLWKTKNFSTLQASFPFFEKTAVKYKVLLSPTHQCRCLGKLR